MKKVYNQPYTNGKSISASFGKPPKGQFKYDVIKLETAEFTDYITPDEAIDIIRALSAAVNHWLTTYKGYEEFVKAKKE